MKKAKTNYGCSMIVAAVEEMKRQSDLEVILFSKFEIVHVIARSTETMKIYDDLCQSGGGWDLLTEIKDNNNAVREKHYIAPIDSIEINLKG